MSLSERVMNIDVSLYQMLQTLILAIFEKIPLNQELDNRALIEIGNDFVINSFYSNKRWGLY